MKVLGFFLLAGAALAEPLRPGVPAEVYVAPGRATSVLLHSAEKVASISLASPVITYKYDRSLNQIEITPAVRHGGVETNLNLRVGPSIYILLVKVVEDVRVQYLREFSLSGDPSADEEAVLDRARPLAPAEIDIVGAARAVAQAERDSVYREAHPNLRIEPIGREAGWNGCTLRLEEVAQFLDLDLLLFRVRWTNRTSGPLSLDPRRCGISAGGRRIPITARFQDPPGAVVFPGETETISLAVQGYRLSRHNDWALLPPPT